MTKEAQHEMASKLVADMRAAFQSRDWDGTSLIYEQLLELKANSGLRLEAACMAARALAAAGERSAAKAILKGLNGAQHKKAVHYEFLARAYLDLKQYENAAQACAVAESLRNAEMSEKVIAAS